MSVNRKMSMEEFSSHKASAGRGGAEMLKWRDDGEDGDGSVRVWLADDPFVLWRHGWRAVREYEKDGKKKQVVQYVPWVTMESKEPLLRSIKKQGYYVDTDRDDDDRHLPEVDPFLKMLEWVRSQIVAEKIDWLDEVFRFEARDDDDVSVRAGALLGIFPRDINDLEDAREQERFEKAKIKLKDERRNAAKVECKYGFVVVTAEKPERGPLIAIESEALGQKIKKLFQHRKARSKAKTEEDKSRDANIVRRCMLEWQFDPKQQFSDMYDVVELFEEVPSKAVLEQFERYDEEADEWNEKLERLTGQGNVALLEQNFRSAWCHPTAEPPWDEIFKAAYEVVKGTPFATLPTDFPHGANAPAEEEAPASVASEPVRLPEPAAPPVATVPCEACGKPMPETEFTCPHCSQRYSDFGGFMAREFVPCEACGKDRPFAEDTCPHCRRQYRATAERVELVPLPEPPQQPEIKASRRRQPA